MQFENNVQWHQNLLHMLDEEDVLQCKCISLTDGNDSIEQKIYLGTEGNEFEVRVYKSNPQVTYLPSILDFKLKRYEANDVFDSFFFDRFFFAHRFFFTLKDFHPEYGERPL